MADKEKKTRKSENVVQRYLRETTGELRKVSWPTRAEAVRLTWLVLGVMVIMAIYLGGIDLVARELRNLAFGIAS